jgi:anti-sigma regulatory factor (Ser/Thr protein kinase)/PAS domain-containing protein
MAAFRTAVKTKTMRSIVLNDSEIDGGSDIPARIIPLIELDGTVQTGIVLIGNGIEQLPGLMAELTGGNSIWSTIVDFWLPEIVLTARPQRGTIDFGNRRWTVYTGKRKADRQALLEAIDPADRRLFETEWRQALVSGTGFVIDVRLRGAEGMARWHRLRASPIPGKYARVVKWLLTLSDVDDMVEARHAAERSRARMDMLAEGSRALQASLDAETLVETACRFAAGRFCDEAVIVVAHGEKRFAGWPAGAATTVLASSLLRDCSSTTWQYFCPAEPSPIADVVSLPIQTRRRELGTMMFGFRSHRSLEPDDLEMFAAFADRLALALENARLYMSERRVAETLQDALLPQKLPRLDGLDMDAAYLPANDEDRVGGDWYDAFELRDGRIALSIGDVGGHGIQAAALMGTLRQTIRTVALDDASPSRVLELTNLAACGSEAGLSTAFFATIDPVEMTLEYATAGHPEPFIVGDDGEVAQLPCSGMALGIVDDLHVETYRSTLPRNGALLLYTDGMIEHSHDLLGGTEALRRRFAQWFRDGATASTTTFANSLLPEHHIDDAVVFLTRFVPVRSLDLKVPAARRQSSVIRRALMQFARGVELAPQRSFDLVVATCEAVNNAIEHAYNGDGGVLFVRANVRESLVTVEVEDHGTWRRGTSDPDRGRGLWIIDSLADDVHLEHGPSGTVVRIVFEGNAPSVSGSKRRELEPAQG